jgi:hypothetical protein
MVDEESFPKMRVAATLRICAPLYITDQSVGLSNLFVCADVSSPILKQNKFNSFATARAATHIENVPAYAALPPVTTRR